MKSTLIVCAIILVDMLAIALGVWRPNMATLSVAEVSSLLRLNDMSQSEVRLFVFRRPLIGGLFDATVGVDGAPVASVPSGTWIAVDLPAGRHIVNCAFGAHSNDVLVQPPEGRTMFIEIEIDLGWTSPNCALLPRAEPLALPSILNGQGIRHMPTGF